MFVYLLPPHHKMQRLHNVTWPFRALPQKAKGGS